MSELRAYEPDEELEQLQGQEIPMLDDTDAEYMLTVKRQAEEHYQKMEAWYAFKLQQEKDRMNRRVAWAESNLRVYFNALGPGIAKVTKTQMSYELPNGKLILKKVEPKYDIKDEELLPWLKKNDRAALVKVKESPDWAALKKTLKVGPDGKSMITADSEIVPGITVLPQEDKFSVSLK